MTFRQWVASGRSGQMSRSPDPRHSLPTHNDFGRHCRGCKRLLSGRLRKEAPALTHARMWGQKKRVESPPRLRLNRIRRQPARPWQPFAQIDGKDDKFLEEG